MKYKLLIKTQDEKGLVFRISKILFDNNFNIEKQSEFVDMDTNCFFFRAEFSTSQPLDENKIETIEQDLKACLPMSSHCGVKKFARKQIVVFVSKESHIVGDLLIKYNSGELNADIVAVISNHQDLQKLVEKFDIPYYYVPHSRENKQVHEKAIADILSSLGCLDVVVLAKYMQIIPSAIVNEYAGRLINIHHSFLPAFIGKNPYHQAFIRGVKMIGATAHFVTEVLDGGAIIDQDLVKIDHTYDTVAMREYGESIETLVLTRALKLVLNDRVFVHNNKTVIF